MSQHPTPAAAWQALIDARAKELSEQENEASGHCGPYGDSVPGEFTAHVATDFTAIGKAYAALMGLQPVPAAPATTGLTAEVQCVPTVPPLHPFTDEVTPPLWRLVVGGQCADLDYEQPARNLAAAVNAAVATPAQEVAAAHRNLALLQGDNARMAEALRQLREQFLRQEQVNLEHGQADAAEHSKRYAAVAHKALNAVHPHAPPK